VRKFDNLNGNQVDKLSRYKYNKGKDLNQSKRSMDYNDEKKGIDNFEYKDGEYYSGSNNFGERVTNRPLSGGSNIIENEVKYEIPG
jgi:hypothetical protein